MKPAFSGAIAIAALGLAFTLKYDFNLLCDLEDDHPDIMEGRFTESLFKAPKYIRSMLQKGLLDADNKPVDLKTAGEIISALGMPAVMGVIGQAIMAAFGVGPDGKSALPEDDALKN